MTRYHFKIFIFVVYNSIVFKVWNAVRAKFLQTFSSRLRGERKRDFVDLRKRNTA